MTDVLDRLQSTPLPEATRAMPRRRLPFAMSDPARMLLAALAAAAGVIHLVMVPSHMAQSTVEGVGFAVAGWSQLVIAALVLIAPSRALLRAGMVANLAFIGAWVVSRTAGLPFGENAGHAESVGFLDLTCVALEAALIVASCAVLARPGLGSALRGRRLGLAAVVPVGILAVTTAAIASPGARNHAHDSHGGAAMAADHLDGASAAGGHHDAAGASDDLGLGMLQNGHHEEMKPTKLSAADQAKVDELLDVSRTVAAKYPTLGAAIDAGFRRAGPFAPGLGIHYSAPWVGQGLNPDGVMDANDMAHPMMAIFDGTEPSAKFAGFMYYSVAADEPTGLPGDNDFWHYHTNTCLAPAADGINAPLGADRSVDPDTCAKLGGSLMAKTQWMVHVWSVPGYEVPQSSGGVFAEANPKLKCSDGTYYMMDVSQMAQHPTNFCKSELR